MKIPATERKLTVSEGIETVEAKIEVSAATFKTLYADIYKDPLVALCRELSANCLDSYVAQDEEKWKELAFARPPRLTSPCREAPTAIFEDFGSGMSKEFILTTFNTFGASTKRESEVAIGNFGQGGKVVYAVADTSHLESVFEGIRNFFVLTRNTSGIPTCSWVGAEETSDPSGTKITVPIKQRDWIEVTKHLGRLLEFSEVPWVFDGVKVEAFKKAKLSGTLPCGTEWFWKGNLGGRTHILVGPVLYEFDTWQVRLEDILRHFHLKLPIGSVELTASRDSLQYSEKTKQFLLKIEKTFGAASLGRLEKLGEECKTSWEFLQLLALYNFYGAYHASWQGKTGFEWRQRDLEDLEKTIGTKVTGVQYIRNRYRQNCQTNVLETSFVLQPATASVFYIDNLKSGGRNRVKKSLNSAESAVVFCFPDAKKPLDKVFYGGELQKILGCEFEKTSSLPEPEKAAKSAKKYSWYDGYRSGRSLAEDIQKGSLFVTLEFGSVCNEDFAVNTIAARCSYGQKIYQINQSDKKIVRERELQKALPIVTALATEFVQRNLKFLKTNEWFKEVLEGEKNVGLAPEMLQGLRFLVKSRERLLRSSGLLKEFAEVTEFYNQNHFRVKELRDMLGLEDSKVLPDKKVLLVMLRLAKKLPELVLVRTSLNEADVKYLEGRLESL